MRTATQRIGSWAVATALLAMAADAPAAPPEDPAAAAIDVDGLLGHIRTLASDEFEGRLPGTPGEDRTVAYLVESFRRLGLKPGNPDGTFLQDVPLLGFQVTSAAGSLQVGAQGFDLRFPDDWVAVSRRGKPEVRVEDSELVFVGYGVVAPEYGWDDYKGLDVRGKTLVMLVNDPPVPDPNDPGRLDPATFQGRAMTYYGRWTYKFEIASEKGAAAALLVHETGPAGYPYSVVVGSWGRENFDIPDPKQEQGRVAVEAWISLETARRVLSATGRDFDELKTSARERSFRPVPLGARGRFEVKSRLREVKSRNVIARLEGSDPRRKEECVVYTAHWDHLGRDATLSGDQVYNGAADNASGVAGLLEIAEAFARGPSPPPRSILFLALTAEEKGLLGAKYYAEHPLYPLARTLAVINMDVINLWGRTTDVTSVGLGQTSLDDLLADAARTRGRVVAPDPEPEKGMYYRSDHFELAKVGVPALYTKGGIRYLGKPDDFGLRKREQYTQNDYHKVTDEVKPDWDLSGAAEDMQLLWEVGDRVARGEAFPEWKPGSEFRSRRQAMLKSSGR